jgi:hypothetical protein
MTAGETFTGAVTAAPVAIAKNGTTQEPLGDSLANTAGPTQWNSPATYLSQGFIMPAGYNRLKSLDFLAGNGGTGTHSGTANLIIYSVDGSGYPTGSALATSDPINVNIINTASLTVSFTFASAVSLVEGTTYSAVLRHNNDGILTGASFINIFGCATSTLGGVYGISTNSGASYASGGAYDLSFLPRGYFTPSAPGRIVRASSFNANRKAIIGFVTSTATDGSSVTVYPPPVALSSAGSLTPSSSYYLNDTPATIGLSPGTNKILVGVAGENNKLYTRIQQADSTL